MYYYGVGTTYGLRITDLRHAAATSLRNRGTEIPPTKCVLHAMQPCDRDCYCDAAGRSLVPGHLCEPSQPSGTLSPHAIFYSAPQERIPSTFYRGWWRVVVVSSLAQAVRLTTWGGQLAYQRPVKWGEGGDE